MVTSVRKLADISDAALHDPKQALLDGVGDTSLYEPFHALILVATYVAPPKMMKGPNGENIQFHLTDRTRQEDRYQGKIGLVLSVGPRAFVDDAVNKFGGVTVKAGDWVVYRASDGFEMFFVDKNGRDGTPCRLLEDVNIKGRVSDPACIY